MVLRQTDPRDRNALPRWQPRTGPLPILGFLLASSLLVQGSVSAVTVKEALAYNPVQRDVDYEKPSRDELESCSIETEQVENAPALVLRGAAGQVLRVFLDMNGDNRVDQWRYFGQGTECYRDIDTNFNGTPDEFRWVGLAGLRHGVDQNEDGRIDRWKAISAEEATYEVFAAVRDADPERFARVLLAPQELKSLGLGSNREQQIQKQIADAAARFRQLVAKQRVVDPKAEWVHFGAMRPGVLPAGSDGAKRDVVLYENVSAMIDTGKEHGQLSVGTLIQVGDTWKVVDVPGSLLGKADQSAVTMFLASLNRAPEQPETPTNALSPEMQSLVAELNSAETAVREARAASDKKTAYQRLSKVLRQLAAQSKTKEDQKVWLRQLSDTLSTAAQSGDYPDGLAELNRLFEELSNQAKGDELTGYVQFRLMLANYSLAIMQAKKPSEFEKIQDEWLQQLEAFVKDYPTSDDTAEAMWQLAIAEEFAGNEKDALTWYERIVKTAPKKDSLVFRKATGARRRLTSVGNRISLGGNTTVGKPYDIQQARGRVVVVHYWATWSDVCLDEIKQIRDLAKEYGKDVFPVGVNLDQDPKVANAFIQQERVLWPHLHEAGGLDSPLAVDFGISSVPTMFLIDADGKMIDYNVGIADLREYLEKKFH